MYFYKKNRAKQRTENQTWAYNGFFLCLKKITNRSYIFDFSSSFTHENWLINFKWDRPFTFTLNLYIALISFKTTVIFSFLKRDRDRTVNIVPWPFSVTTVNRDWSWMKWMFMNVQLAFSTVFDRFRNVKRPETLRNGERQERLEGLKRLQKFTLQKRKNHFILFEILRSLHAIVFPKIKVPKHRQFKYSKIKKI